MTRLKDFMATMLRVSLREHVQFGVYWGCAGALKKFSVKYFNFRLAANAKPLSFWFGRPQALRGLGQEYRQCKRSWLLFLKRVRRRAASSENGGSRSCGRL